MVLRLAAFDLDGTLLRGQTACEAISKGIGRIERMRELERLESTDIEEMRSGILTSRSVIFATTSPLSG